MILQAGAQDLLAVEKILGSDEPDDGVHQQRIISPGDRVGPRFAGLLIDAVVRIGGKRASLSGFEIHDVCRRGRSSRAAWQASSSIPRLIPKARFAASVPAID